MYVPKHVFNKMHILKWSCVYHLFFILYSLHFHAYQLLFLILSQNIVKYLPDFHTTSLKPSYIFRWHGFYHLIVYFVLVKHFLVSQQISSYSICFIGYQLLSSFFHQFVNVTTKYWSASTQDSDARYCLSICFLFEVCSAFAITQNS